MKRLYLFALTAVLLGAGCSTNTPTPVNPAPAPTPAPVATTTDITYYVTPNANDQYQYCNGADMNSAGYKNALSKKVTITVPGVLTDEQKIITTLLKAQADSSFAGSDAYTRVASTTFAGGVVTVRPASGWAGVSIFMCAWQPFVEKNVMQYPEVKSVKWEAQDNV